MPQTQRKAVSCPTHQEVLTGRVSKETIEDIKYIYDHTDPIDRSQFLTGVFKYSNNPVKLEDFLSDWEDELELLYTPGLVEGIQDSYKSLVEQGFFDAQSR